MCTGPERPPGVDDDVDRVLPRRLPGRPQPEPGGRSGDLYVEVKVAEDERFRRHGDDLVTVVDLSATKAMVGTSISVETLEGSRDVEVPPGTQPGSEISLSGLGLPRLGGGRRGNQRLVFNIVVPANLSEEQQAAARALDETIQPENLETESGRGFFSRVRRAFG